MGCVVYDEADLNKLEKEEAQQEGNGGEKENLDVGASQPMPENPRKGKKPARDVEEHEPPQYTERRRGGDEIGDVPMAADISTGGYLDIDDGRLLITIQISPTVNISNGGRKRWTLTRALRLLRMQVRAVGSRL